MIGTVAGRARGLRAAVRAARDRRDRMPPKLAATDRADRPPRVLYLAPDLAKPSGGSRTIYRHVDLLNAMGIEAAAVHHRRGFRYGWFPNSTRVLAAGQVTVGPDDILVVPEWYAAGLHRLPGRPRKIVFNQGPYHTFDGIPYASTGPGEPYTTTENLVALLTVSADGARLLRCAFPTLPVSQVRAVVDGTLFRPPDAPAQGEHSARRRIAYMPRRRPQEVAHLLHILRSRGSLDGWELVPIDGYTEEQTAELMRSCALFLSFSEREGFGLPPAEAMASGCYVVGFTGLGGRDFFDSGYCSPVPDSDLYAYVTAVEEAIDRHRSAPDALARAGRLASRRILGHYHESGLREDLAAVYQPLRGGGTPQPAPADAAG